MATPTLVGSVTTATSTSTSFNCNKPTGVAAGDLMLSLQFSDSGIGAITSGWAELQTIVDAGFDSRVGMKVAGGSEGANYAFAQGSGAAGGAIIIALSGVASETPVSGQANGVGSGALVTTPTVTAVGGDDLDVRFAIAINAASFTAPAGFSLQATAAGSGIAGACATRALTGPGATGTADFTANVTPPDRYGYTIAVQGLASLSPRIIVSTAARHRAASW